MLRIDETFRQEVSAARNWRDKHLMHWKAMKERFTGPAYRHENYTEGADIENIVGQYVFRVSPTTTPESTLPPMIRNKIAVQERWS